MLLLNVVGQEVVALLEEAVPSEGVAAALLVVAAVAVVEPLVVAVLVVAPLEAVALVVAVVVRLDVAAPLIAVVAASIAATLALPICTPLRVEWRVLCAVMVASTPIVSIGVRPHGTTIHHFTLPSTSALRSMRAATMSRVGSIS